MENSPLEPPRADASQGPAQEPPRIGAVASIFGALFNPGETFAQVARKPSWIVPWLALTAVALIFNVVMAKRVDWNVVIRQQIEKNAFASRQLEQLPPEQRDRALQASAKRQPYVRYFRGACGPLILIVIFGAINLLGFNLSSGAGLSYKSSLAMTAYGYLPIAVKELLAIPVLLARDPAAIDPENFLASNLASFLPDGAPLWQMALGAAFDLFTFWALFVTALGFHALAPNKISKGLAFGVVIGIWAIIALFFTGLATMFS